MGLKSMGQIILHSVNVAYRKHLVLKNIDLCFKQGEQWAICGRNGSGKSTLLKTIYHLIKPLIGQIQWVNIPSSAMAYLAQEPQFHASATLTVFEFVCFGLWYEISFYKAVNSSQVQQVQDALHVVGLQDLAKQSIDRLSRGQLQRSRLARALVQKADFLLLDEPFNAVDEGSIQRFLSLFARLRKEGKTVIAVLHNSDIVTQYFSHIVRLDKVSHTASNAFLTQGK